jgi:hypothetical protein
MTLQPHVLISLGTAGSEKSWTLPANTKTFTIQNREGDTNVIYYFSSTANAPTGNAYFSLQGGSAKTFQGSFGGQTIYFQAVGNANRNLEIEYQLYP